MIFDDFLLLAIEQYNPRLSELVAEVDIGPTQAAVKLALDKPLKFREKF
jgi:hypothetical protein